MKNKLKISKIIIFCLLCSTIFFGCELDNRGPKEIEQEELNLYKSQYVKFTSYGSDNYTKINTVIIDSCEYLYAWFGAGNGGGSFTHKGNCKFCSERNKKLMLSHK